MTERQKIDEIKCVDEFIAFLEDNEVQEIDDVGEATDTLNSLRILWRGSENVTRD